MGNQDSSPVENIRCMGPTPPLQACVSRYDQSAWIAPMTKLRMMHILPALVFGCISAHPRLQHQKTKRET